MAGGGTTAREQYRLVAAIRLGLALAGLVAIFHDASVATRAVLILYGAYSSVLLLLSFSRSSLSEQVGGWSHWGDVCWYAALVALTGGSQSIVFYGFYFPVVAASFRWGFASGSRVVLVSTLLFLIMALPSLTVTTRFEHDRFFLRPIYLLVLGLLIAFWGGFEVAHRRKLAFLGDVATLKNPRFGVDRTLGLALERLRAFQDADTVVLVGAEQAGEQSLVRRADRHDSEAAMHAEPLAADLAERLLSFPSQQIILWQGSGTFSRSRRQVRAWDSATDGAQVADPEACETVATLLEAESFLSVPVHEQAMPPGRLYLTATEPRAFAASDVPFVIQATSQLMSLVQNLLLLDQLASTAVEEERRRIALDLHDSLIQPYLGLEIGLAAIREKVTRGETDIRPDLDGLIEITRATIANVRLEVHSLPHGSRKEDGLVLATRSFATKFASTTGITVDVDAEDGLRVTDRLGAAIFQMIVEGLSNVRRHTEAGSALIRLSQKSDRLCLQIENTVRGGAAPPPFRPRSISERAKDLAGETTVHLGGDRTIVDVRIPL